GHEHDHEAEEHDHDHDSGSSCGAGGCGHGHEHGELTRTQIALVATSGVATALGLALRYFAHLAPEVSLGFFAVAVLSGGWLVFPHAWSSLRSRRLDMNVLMTVAVVGAWLLRDQAEAASVVFLFSLSELLESWAGQRARKAVNTLLDLSPPTALLLQDGREAVETAVAEITVGQSILAKSGSRIPLDGEVVSGESSVNQAPITGESVPVSKAPGDPVYAGTINGDGSLTIRVTKTAGESKLAQIVKLVGEAEHERPPTQRFVDRFAAVYTPTVFAVALLVAIVPPLLMGQSWQPWIYRALVLLVIACPCALVIATPVSIISGITALARRGVLVKGAIYLEAVGKLRALAVDKTGTITQGEPKVVAITTLSDLNEDEVLARAAAINAHSEHPLALAVTRAAKERGLKLVETTDYRSVTGRGAKANYEGHPHFIGNHRMAHDTGTCSPEVERILAGIEDQGQSLAIVGHEPHPGCAGELLGIIAIADTLRPEVIEALKKIHAAGVEKVVMLSGDNEKTAAAIARQAGIDEAHGELMPDQKVEHIRQLVKRYEHVGMIGDGVNDAPALAVASVGFAMGAIGSDTAIETADIALMKDDLTKVAEAISMGKRTLKIIRFNLTFALVVKAIFLVLTMFGVSNMWWAILADTGATLLVILNSLRLMRD
ncbi:MAG: heavy metal translocating P-type ATPase, partial [Akkermansiaceae bacterium]|nr:heavy metal translocating P-type ATPase [Akkermansiaceae bacterium]